MQDDIFSDALSQVTTGERLLWSGRPRPGLVFTAQDGCLLPFSLLWTGFSCLWEGMAIASGAPWFFLLMGLPFLAVGFYLLVGRLILGMLQRRRTRYALTSQRIIIMSGLRGRRIHSLTLRDLEQIRLNEGRDGSGTITFGAANPGQWWANNPAGIGLPGRPAFERIPEARRVHDLILEAKAGA
jgi:hypothetical protein